MVERQIIIYLQGNVRLTQQEIAKASHSTRYRVRLVISRLRETGIAYAEALAMPDAALSELIYPSKSMEEPKDDFDAEHWAVMVTTKKHVTRYYVWEKRYCPVVIDQGLHPLSYSQFCNKLRAYIKQSESTLIMPMNREPGKELFIDWCGDKLEIVDLETGEIINVYVFVTALGDSGFPFVKAYRTMTQIDWLKAHDDAFKYYGGLPRVLVPDCTKTAVIDRKLYDTTLNQCYLQMAYHYRIAIIPARVRKPRDKGPVEGTVGWVENNVFSWILDQGPFYDLEPLNLAIQERVDELCDKEYQKRPGTRRSVYEELDKKALLPLIDIPFDYFETEKTRVGKDYTVRVGDFYYTVPYTYALKEVSIHIFSDKIEVWRDSECIATHTRAYTGPRKVINPEHMPPNHKYVYEYRLHDGDYYRAQAKALGAPVLEAINAILSAGPTEEHNYKACEGIIELSGKYGADAINNACQRALSIQSVTYTTISKMITADDTTKASAKTAKKAAHKATNSSSRSSARGIHENIRTDWS